MEPVTLRAHYSGPNVMVVVAGALDADGAHALAAHLRQAQGDGNLIIDLWDVKRFESPAVGVLTAAKQRAEAAGWGFALVADPTGPCREVIEAAGETENLRPCTTRQEARAALQQS